MTVDYTKFDRLVDLVTKAGIPHLVRPLSYMQGLVIYVFLDKDKTKCFDYAVCHELALLEPQVYEGKYEPLDIYLEWVQVYFKGE